MPNHLILIGCGKEKAATPRPAHDLYTGQLFAARRRYAEQSSRQWWIVSAKHGLIYPPTIIAPYDLTIGDLRPVDAAAWQLGTVVQLLSELPDDTDLRQLIVEIHAGAEYATPLIECLDLLGIPNRSPLKGYAIGEQLQWYSQKREVAHA